MKSTNLSVSLCVIPFFISRKISRGYILRLDIYGSLSCFPVSTMAAHQEILSVVSYKCRVCCRSLDTALTLILYHTSSVRQTRYFLIENFSPSKSLGESRVRLPNLRTCTRGCTNTVFVKQAVFPLLSQSRQFVVRVWFCSS